jgi:hypothetical protein
MLDEGTSLENLKGKHQRDSRGEKRRKKLEARAKPTQRYAGALETTSATDKSTEDCKVIVFQVLYAWFKDRLYKHINRKFLALREIMGRRHSKAIWASYLEMQFPMISGMRRNVNLAISIGWEQVDDELYNIVSVFEKYRKL